MSLSDAIRSLPVSGLYVRREWVSTSPWELSPVVKDRVRLDVDGSFPQMAASGKFYRYTFVSFFEPVEWFVKDLQRKGSNVWEGEILKIHPVSQNSLPHRRVRIVVEDRYLSFSPSKLTITFTEGAPDITRVLEFESPYFRVAEFEFDTVEGAPRVMTLDTTDQGQQTISGVYSRAGIEVQRSPNSNTERILALSGTDNIWTDQELHDAMRVFWSRYKSRAQWAQWTLFAGYYERPETLGTMFDLTEAHLRPADEQFQRQGAAVFGQRIADVMTAQNATGYEIKRNQFFAAIHEIGHCFNLAHVKSRRDSEVWLVEERDLGGPVDPDAVSIMHRPYDVQDFWRHFKYRFDDYELKFLRHAPEEFVEMGGAAFLTDHQLTTGSYRESASPTPRFALAISVGHATPVFEFLEPVIVELTLTNVSGYPQLINAHVLEEADNIALVIQPRGGAAQIVRPFAHHCHFHEVTLLHPGQSISTSVFASAGSNGWCITEPGAYTLFARVSVLNEIVGAMPFSLRVMTPQQKGEEYFAQDYFTDDVARTFVFGGTSVMTAAIETLRRASDQFDDYAVARHAQLALGRPLMKDRKVLRVPEGEAPMASVAAEGGRLVLAEAKPEEARQLLEAALLRDGEKAEETFGSIAYRRYREMYSTWLASEGAASATKEMRPGSSKEAGPRAGGETRKRKTAADA